MKRESPLENHPELNEQGIPYRNSSKRSSVAEAHRRALARRDKERRVKDEREQIRVADLTPSPTPDNGSATSTGPAVPPLSPAGRPPLAPMPRTELRSLGIKVESEKVELPQRTNIALPASSPRAPMMPKPTPAPAQVEPERSIAAARDEAVDRVIQNAAPPIAVEPSRETAATIPSAPSVTPAPAPADPRAVSTVEPPVALADSSAPHGLDMAAPPDPEAKPAARYWHEVPTTGQYTRMELPPAQGSTQRQPSQVGRQRPEPLPETRPAVTRRIRTMDEARNGHPADAPAATPPVAPPPRVAPPRPTATSQPVAAPPPTPEVAPRQIDEALLRQLETNWRTQELAAHAGQRCGNCRFFRPAEGGQGNCGCSFSNVYGRPIEPQGLSCLDGLGTWWAANDDGWLERTERRPRRATPLLDALLREREEELARSMPERRRAR